MVYEHLLQGEEPGYYGSFPSIIIFLFLLLAVNLELNGTRIDCAIHLTVASTLAVVLGECSIALVMFDYCFCPGFLL